MLILNVSPALITQIINNHRLLISQEHTMHAFTRPLLTLCLLLSLATLSSACATTSISQATHAHTASPQSTISLAHDDAQPVLVTPHELNQLPLVWR